MSPAASNPATSAAAPIDDARAVRAGEELPAAPLEAWLLASVPGLQAPFSITQFPKGHSNLTYLVTDAAGRELVLRRPPFGSKVKTAHDMGREFRILSRLAGAFPLAPRPLAHTDEPAVIGAPFYVMERLRGLIFRGARPPVELSPAKKRAVDEALIDTLADLHAFDYRKAGLADLGKPDGYIERQITGWTRRYADAKTDEIPEVEQIAAWLSKHRPPESGAALIHNDYKFDNLVLDADDPAKVIGILDWEMSTLGDPLMDLGTALAWWVEDADRDELKAFAFGPTLTPGSLTRRELAERYSRRSGRDISGLLFHYCFSLFKNAVVAQQIYARYKAGLTKDERFARMIFGVSLLTREAVAASERGSLGA
jgi:aminoglycoside phosphotransferase (APT) family kinase protein